MEKYFSTNLALWNELTEINSKSSSYNLEEFKMGGIVLPGIVKEEVGDVKGKSLLHLQCHFGMDTLSWARLGAKVTGVDFSDKAINLARALRKELNLEANFICSNIYNLQEVLTDEKFDIVFTSMGVLCWLPDLNKWAKIIAHYLKENGIFYIFELHPILNIFENESHTKELKIRYSYFHKEEPMKWEPDGVYADRTKVTKNPSYEWTHSMSDIINSLIKAGLEIEFIHEYPYCNYDHFPFMKKDEDGWWRIKGSEGEMPLLFSIRAKKK